MTSKVLRMSDRVSLKVGDIEFILAPLSRVRKQELLSCSKMQGGKEVYDLLGAQALYMKYSIKGIKGLKNHDDTAYELRFEGDYLSDDCVDELLNIEERHDLTVAAWQILNGIKGLKDPETGEEMKNVVLEVINSGK